MSSLQRRETTIKGVKETDTSTKPIASRRSKASTSLISGRKVQTKLEERKNLVENGRHQNRPSVAIENGMKNGGKGKETTSNRGERSTTKKPKVDEKLRPAVQEEEQHYEEDFEDYESDFEEEEDDKGPKDVRQQRPTEAAVEEQKEESLLLRKLTLGQQQQRVAISGEGEMEIEGAAGKVANFVPEQREFTIGQLGEGEGAQRGDNGGRLLDYFKELAGQQENYKQMGTQTEGPSVSIGSQTEVPERRSREVQSGRTTMVVERHPIDQTKVENSWRLGKFVSDSAQLISDLLSLKGESTRTLSALKSSTNLRTFSSNYASHSLNTLFKGECRLCAIAVKNPPTSICLSIFVHTSNDIMQNRKSFIAEFPLIDNSAAEPERLFCCDQEVAFLRYSPAGASSTLFAALKDGSLVSWNLHGRVKPPPPPTGSQLRMPILLPNGNTAFTSMANHEQSPSQPDATANWADLTVTGMEVLGGGPAGNSSSSSRTLAQLVVLHESGLIRCWTALAGAREEGLEMGEGIELLLTATLRCPVSKFEFASSLAINMRGSQAEALVGTTKGRILRVGGLNGGKAVDRDGLPMEYGMSGQDYGEITSIKFANSQLFAATMADQWICLFQVNEPEPIKEFRSPTKASLARSLSSILFEWSPSEKNVFYSIHAGEQIAIWKEDAGLVLGAQTEICEFYSEFRTKIQCSLCWRDQSGNSFMAFGLVNGSAQVHILK